MARKNLLAGLLDEKLPAGNSAVAPQPASPTQPIQGMQSSAFGPRGGAIGAVTRSIEQLKAHAVLDLATDVIDASLIADRLADTGDDHKLLVASIREHGQQVPILVRPHPDHEGRYQIAYGRRRLRALKELGQTVRAIVKPLSNEQLVVAQGQENSARTDLSFIEKALFAARLEEGGFDRETIMAALSVDKSGLSRLISSAVRIPNDIIEAIGPAPKAGRDRWIELSARLDGAAAIEKARKAMAAAQFSTLSSDERFSKIFEGAAPKKAKAVRPTIWRSDDGLRIASIRDDPKALTVTIDKKVAADFGAYLVETIPEIYAAFKRRAGA
ncbi:plasmid partitioning protein RepB [Bosea eneae]|uniref:Plasmid partitioning protein RepB n=1 Tax=Bosea eneae TaxID=151454 RepID=A0ABW0IYC8_9HYPH